MEAQSLRVSSSAALGAPLQAVPLTTWHSVYSLPPLTIMRLRAVVKCPPVKVRLLILFTIPWPFAAGLFFSTVPAGEVSVCAY